MIGFRCIRLRPVSGAAGVAVALSLVAAPAPGQSDGRPRPNASAASRSARGRQALLRYLRQGQLTPYLAEQTTRAFGADMAESRQVVKHAGPARQRIEYLAPPSLRGEVILILGARILHYRPLPEPTIVEGDAGLEIVGERAKELLQALRSGKIKVTATGSQIVAGREADIIEVRPSSGGPFRRLWIDRACGVRLKHETVDGAGNVVASSYFTRVRLNPSFERTEFRPGSLPRVPYRAQAPASPRLDSIAAAQRLVEFTIRAPTLPDRYSIKGVWLIGGPRRRGVLLQYGDGVNTVTLSQRPLPRGAPRNSDRELHIGRGVALWTTDDRVYTLFGTLRPDVLRAAVNSLR